MVDQTDTITFWNKASKALYGWSDEEVMGRKLKEIMTHFNLQSQPNEVRKYIKKGESWSKETNVLKKDGLPIPVHVTYTPILDENGNLKGAIGISYDISERKKSEDAIKKMNTDLEQSVILRTQQLEYANKELEAFTYSVSHDLRAPLRNINGWGQVLMEEYKAKLDENGVKYLDRVLAETLRMNNLIDDLLKLSRVTIAEKKRETVDLTAIALNIVRRLKDKPINHKLEFNIQPGIVAIGDPRLLDIALTNLLENSYKFTGKLPHAIIEFGMSEMERKTVYWVKDNGVGFDMENSKNLFGVFQRMHNQNEFPGTGIGLATVQRIIHRHDGVIWADSKLNGGTTFFFTIPDENS
jgi:PAS domain S-box-containing protein